MRLKLIGIVLASVFGFAQTPAPVDPSDLWLIIRNVLTTAEADRYFEQVKDCQIPPTHVRFTGRVVSQPSPNELIVNVDDPAGDAGLRFLFSAKGTIAPGTLVHFKGVLRSYTKNPYRLTLEVDDHDIDGLP
ncbi:MAG TPA: hypothetical protein VNH18_35950 [Bryobacteraceae bacterium]|nr:hypothetical protein [Bryobacteraceae bacterium]